MHSVCICRMAARLCPFKGPGAVAVLSNMIAVCPYAISAAPLQEPHSNHLFRIEVEGKRTGSYFTRGGEHYQNKQKHQTICPLL